MAAPVPVFYDPSQVQLTMPVPTPSRPPSKSHALEILKILVGLIIALALVAILAALLFVPRTSSGVDLRESNENIAKLQRESNENIARLQREQQLKIENDRQIHQEYLIEKHRLEDRLLERERREQQLHIENRRLEHQQNLTDQYRVEDRLIEQQHREQDSAFNLAKLRQYLQIEERRIQILVQDRQITEQHREEDRSKVTDNLLYDFMEEIMSAKGPLDTTIIKPKVHSLIRRFDASHKSSMINFLYKNKLLNSKDSETEPLDLQEVNLKELVLNKINADPSQVGLQLNYTGLSLPSTNLINASFEQIYINQANFSLCTMMGASFQLSQVTKTDFSHADLSFSDFRYANVSQSDFTNAKTERASFQNAILYQADMNNANFRSTSFQGSTATETDFTQSDLSYTNFQNAKFFRAHMNDASIGSANFQYAEVLQTNFSFSYLSDCMFQGAVLTGSSFRNAFLAGANFFNAYVDGVDFSSAMLQGANITSEQLDIALSIVGAILPDGSRGRNKNLVKNGDAQCAGMNDTVADWINNGSVFVDGNQFSTDCAFQAREINATLQQTIDLRRYKRLIENGQGKLNIETQEKADGNFNQSMPRVYMNVRFFDLSNNEIHPEMSSLGSTSFKWPSTFASTFACPPTTAELQITIVFRQANTTVDNILVNIE